MRVGLTYSLKTDYKLNTNDPPDANAEFDHPGTIDLIAKAFKAAGHQVQKIGNVESVLESMNTLDVDIVFNISEGRVGRNRESQVPILLEMKGIPFVGSDSLSLALSLDKIIAKKVFIGEGIPTPKFYEIKSLDQEILLDHMKFPMFVKPRFEGSSKGLTESSRVANESELRKQVEHIIVNYKQPALIEEFIRGEEFTVAVIGNDPPEALPVVQIRIGGQLNLKDKFYTFGHIKSDDLEYVCPAPVSESLSKKLKDLAVRTYNAIDCRDFGRVDIRVDEHGNPYVLEINPLPSLSSADVFNDVAKTMGISYNEIVCRILQAALKRCNLV